MHWLFFATLSILSISVSNLFQKLAMKKEESDPVISSILFQFLLTAFSGAFALIKGFHAPPLTLVFPYFMISAVLYGIGSVFVFKAIKIIEASEMVILTGFGAIVTIVTGYIFFHEQLSLLQLLGVAAILAAVVIVKLERKTFAFNRGIGYALIATILFPLAVTNDAFILKSYDAISYTPLMCVLPAIVICFLYPKKALSLRTTLTTSINRNLFIYSFLYSIQVVTYYLALEKGALVSKFNALFRVEIVLTVILASIYLKETKRIPQKIAAAVLTTLGVILIA